MDQRPSAPPHPSSSARCRVGHMVREPDDRKIAGVCSGLADAVGVDVTVVRVATVVLALMTPLVPIGYLIASVVVPERRPDQSRVRAGRVHLGRIPHPLIVVVAIVAVAALVDDAWWLNPFPAAVALVGIGVWLIVDGRNDAPDGPPGPAGTTYADGPPGPAGTTYADGPPPAGPVDATGHAAVGADDTLDAHGPVDAPPDDAPADAADRAVDDAAGADAGGSAAEGDGPPASTEPEGWWTAPARPWWEAGQPAASATTPAVGPAPAPSRPAQLGPAVVAVLLVAGGALWLLTALDIVTLSATGVLAGGLVLIGLALVVGAWRGRAYGLVPLGVVLAALLVAGEVLDVPFDAGIGDRTLTVETAAALRDDHRLFLGDLTVDLTGAPLPEGRATEVEASVGVGDLHVIVPRDATVGVHATSRAGDLVASRGDGVSPGRTRGDDDVGIDESFTIDGPAGGPRLDLDLSTGIGDIEVSHG